MYEDRHRSGCGSSAPLRLIQSFSKLRFTPEFIPCLIGHLAQIVPKPAIQGCLLLFLPPFENFFPSTAVDIGRRHISDPFVLLSLAEWKVRKLFPISTNT